jgi:hypothetical protein
MQKISAPVQAGVLTRQTVKAFLFFHPSPVQPEPTRPAAPAAMADYHLP